MTAFGVLTKCLPFFVCVGLGFNVVLSALVPSWRKKGWKHWKLYNDCDGDYNPNSWWIALGFAKPRKPTAEGDLDEKTALWLYSGLGTLLILIGLAGIIWIAYLSPGA